MTYYSVSKPYEVFYDNSGDPLEDGFIYIGEANQNPITNPITVYWDVNGLYSAAQPIRTLSGYPVRNGSPAKLYIDNIYGVSYSIVVLDKHQRNIYSNNDEYLEILTSISSGLHNIKEFGVTGNGITNDTVNFQAALDSNYSLYIPYGVYLVDELNIPAAASGAVYTGAGFWHYGDTLQTVIKARTLGQTHIFSLDSGADNITFRDMRIDADDKADICIDGTYGAFLGLDNLGIYSSVLYGLKNRQGLLRARRVYASGHAAIGLSIYSDGTLTDSESTGGTIPIELVAGGNRLSNIWANSGDTAQISLAPLDASTTHINTSLINLYVGETEGGAVASPIISIQGNASQKVQQVQLSNSHIVCAASPDKINIGIQIDEARDIAINNIATLGFTTPSATKYLQNFISASNTVNLSVTGGISKNITKNVIYLDAACYNVNISGHSFSEFATSIAAGTEGAAIFVNDNVNYGSVMGCTFDISGVSAVPYAMQGGTANRWNFDNSIRYTNTDIWVPASGTFSGAYELVGTNRKKFEFIDIDVLYKSTGQITAGASSTTTFVTLENANENRVYLISVRQSGGAANNVFGYAMSYGASSTAIRMAQDNTLAALDMDFTVSGLALQLVLGSGYGATTWDWTLTRIK
jgi:hypothetical protein